MSEESAKAIAKWLRSNLEQPIGARSTTLTIAGKIVSSLEDDVSVVPISEASRGGQAATCRARVTIDGELWDGTFAVRAEILEFDASQVKRRRLAVQMAHIAKWDRTAAKVMTHGWRTAQTTVLADAVGSHGDGDETVGLDIMQWAEPFAAAFAGLSGRGRVDRAVELAIPLFSGLDHIHEHHGVIHRDIDPSNVMFAGDRLVLVDWGIASAVTVGTSTLTAPIGKSGPYLAPETSNFQEIGRFTDAWALGVLLCEMACGEPPIVRDRRSGEIQLPAKAGDLPRWLRDIITGLTIVDRHKRMTLKAAVASLLAAGAAEGIEERARSESRSSSTATTAPMAETAPQTDDLVDRRASAKMLLAQGYDLDGLGQRWEAVAAYTSLVDTCDGDPDPVLRQQVAMALNNKQWSLHQMSQHTEAVATCSRLVHTFGGDPDLALRQQVAMALNGSGYSKRELSLVEQAVTDWNEVITRFGGDPDLVLRQQVAMALRDKGLALAGLDRRVEAVGAYTRLIESFERDSDLLLRRQVAMALNNKRWSLYWLGQHAEAIAACTRLVDTFGGDRDLVVRQQVAMALRSKGLILNRSRRREEAVAAYGRLVDIFAIDPDPIVQDSVAWARRQLRAG